MENKNCNTNHSHSRIITRSTTIASHLLPYFAAGLTARVRRGSIGSSFLSMNHDVVFLDFFSCFFYPSFCAERRRGPKKKPFTINSASKKTDPESVLEDGVFRFDRDEAFPSLSLVQKHANNQHYSQCAFVCPNFRIFIGPTNCQISGTENSDSQLSLRGINIYSQNTT